MVQTLGPSEQVGMETEKMKLEIGKEEKGGRKTRDNRNNRRSAKCYNHGCLVTSSLGITSFTVLLLFLLSTTNAVNSTRRDEDLRNSSLRTTSGKIVRLDCGGGSNRRMIKWTKENVRLPLNHRQQIHANGSLVISNVHKSDGGLFTCYFKEGEKENVEKRTIFLRVIDGPRLVPFEFPSDVMVGVRVKIMCSVSQGDPPFTFKWRIRTNGSTIDVRNSSFIDKGLKAETSQDYAILSIENVQVSQAGNYTCFVSNEGDEQSYTSTLRVNEPPKWLHEPRDASTIAGSDVILDCGAYGSPEPSITWKKAGDPWDLSPVYDSPRFTINPNGSLLVHDASSDVDGLYLCSASNGFGSDIGKVIRLTVHEPARFVSRMKSESIRKGHSAELQCRALGDSPIEITWSKEDGTIQETKDRFLIRRSEEKERKLTSSTLVIQSSDRVDGGLYKCNATNKWGQDMSFIQLIIEETPEKPIHLQIQNVTGTSANISWIEPFNGNSNIIKYVIKLNDPVSNETLSETFCLGPNVTIENLRPNTAFLATVIAINEVGWSDPSDPVLFRTEEAPPSGPPLNVLATATGPNSVKLSWKSPSEDTWNGQISGYYITYFASGSEMEQYKVLEASNKRITAKDPERFEVHLTNLQRSTRYLASVQAFNIKGKGPPSPEVSVKTLDDVPPTAPVLRIHSATSSSITLAWNFMNSLGASGVYQFVLYLKKLSSSSEWREIPISTSEMLFAINGLECGQSYEFYMTAHNSVGKSEPSAPIVGRTQGSAPAPSSHNELFVKITSNEAILNLASWKPVLCSILYFTIRIRIKGQREWLTVTSRQTVPPSSNPDNMYFVRNLMPNNPYELEVLAHSSGGSSQAVYEFSTKSLDGSIFKMKPSSADTIQTKYDTSSSTHSSHASHHGLITPILVSTLILVFILIFGCILCSSKESFHLTRNRHSSPDGVGSFLSSSNKQVPFQTVSLKELASNENGSGCTIQLQEQMQGRVPTYARPYDVFPMQVAALDSTLRRGEPFRESTFQQERTLYESLVPSSEM